MNMNCEGHKMSTFQLSMWNRNPSQNLWKDPKRSPYPALYAYRLYLVLPWRLNLLKLLAYVGTIVNGNRLGLVSTLSMESSSSSMTPGPGNIFRDEQQRDFRISLRFVRGLAADSPFRGGGATSDPDETSLVSNFSESTYNFTSILSFSLSTSISLYTDTSLYLCLTLRPLYITQHHWLDPPLPIKL